MTQRIAVLSSMATRGVLAVLMAAYERRSGQSVSLVSVGGVDAAKRIRAGDSVDVVVLAAKVMAELEDERYLVSGSRVAVACSGIAVAVRAGQPHPGLADESDVRRAVGQAKSIAYSTGPSGDHLKRLLDRWDIRAGVADRLVQAPPGVSVGSLIACGEADLGVQQASEFIGVDGIEVVGPLPAGIQSTTIFTGGVCRTASSVATARALLTFVAAPENDAAKRDHGMEPA